MPRWSHTRCCRRPHRPNRSPSMRRAGRSAGATRMIITSYTPGSTADNCGGTEACGGTKSCGGTEAFGGTRGGPACFGIAPHVAEAGCDPVHVFDLDRSAADALARAHNGIVVEDTAKTVAQAADAVTTMLPAVSQGPRLLNGCARSLSPLPRPPASPSPSCPGSMSAFGYKQT